jgi:DNA phosphorothioation-dependent restriction protein DptH
MSVKPFEEFMVDCLFRWVKKDIQPGARYHFKSADYENTVKLYEAFVANSIDQSLDFNGHELKYIEIDGIRVLFAMQGDSALGFTENYISHLRDKVASQSGVFSNCALFYIHNSSLDTLINSATDVGAEGAIWHPKIFHKELNNLIILHGTQLPLFTCLLEDQMRVVVDDGATIFGFSSLYKSLSGGVVDFEELGLFEDPMLLQMVQHTPQIKRRLEENRSLRRDIEFSVANYRDQLDGVLTKFSTKFIEANFDESSKWKKLTFEKYVSEMHFNKTPKLELLETRVERAIFQARTRSNTKAGQREISLLMHYDIGASDVIIHLDFSGNELSTSQIKVACNEKTIAHELEVDKAKGKIFARVKIVPSQKVTFFSVELNRSNRAEEYKIRCLLVESGLFELNRFRTFFKVESAKSLLTLQLDENKLTIGPDVSNIWTLNGPQDRIDWNIFGSIDFNSVANQSDIIQFWLDSGQHSVRVNIEGAAANTGLATPLLFDKARSGKLFRDEENAEYNRHKKRVILDNSEHSLVGVRQQLIDFEAWLIDNERLSRTPDDAQSLPLKALALHYPDLHASYVELFKYFRENKTLPSLCAWGAAYRKIVKRVLDCFEVSLVGIQLNKVLSEEDRILLQIGVHSNEDRERLSPIHPLVLSYHLMLVNEVLAEKENNGTSSFFELPDITTERLVASGLFPYAYYSEADYANLLPVKENQFWLDLVPQRVGNSQYVRRLVKDKLSEFTKAYSKLFDGGRSSTLIVNAINQGKANELFLGIIDFFRHDSTTNQSSLHVNFYDHATTQNHFDLFAEAGTYDKAQELLGVKGVQMRAEVDTLIDYVRSRLTYSKFPSPAAGVSLEYAHLAFFKNDVPVDIQDVNIESQLSGVLCGGLISGEAAETKSQSYFTAFGLRDVDSSNIQSLRLAKLIGMLWKPSRHLNAQYLGTGIGLAVSPGFKELLTRSYDSALWTTIIDPKVTLDFFTSQKDVVLIHYSDQYTSSAGYDAITVTKQIDLFQRLIKADSNVGSDKLLSEFNAFNGEWLLKMLTAPAKDRKEKHGVIGAYKFVTAMLRKSDICWVPLSVAEMIRVSGNVGLKMSESDFSRSLQGYKKGAISDDVLFVGFSHDSLYLLPLEVKTGAHPDYAYAAMQVVELKRYLTEDVLGPNTLAGRMYRSLFARQIFIQLEKFRLYKVLVDEKSNNLLASRQRWLNGDYLISELSNYPEGIVLAHLDSDCCFGPSYKLRESNVLQVELPYALLPTLIAAESASGLDGLVESFNIPAEFILSGAMGLVPEHSSVASHGLTTPEDFPNAQTSVEQEAEYIEHSVSPLAPLSTAATSSEPRLIQVLLGTEVIQGLPLIWEPTNTSKFMNTNTGIIGTMGTGKTQFTKSLVTQLISNQEYNLDGAPIGLLIFDYKSDYVDPEFVNAVSASCMRLHLLPYNPLSLYGSMPMLPVHTATGFSETMAKAFGLGQKQQLRLRKLILEAYANAGILPSTPSTWDLPCPTITTVWNLFLAQDKVEEDSLYAALDSLATYQIFESDPQKVIPLYKLLERVTVIELAGYSPQIQNLVVALTLDLFYVQMQKQGKPQILGDLRQLTKMILVDEADNFMKEDFSSLRKILKEGREYGVGVILSTQEITHFKTGENNYASYVLTWVIHRVAEIKNADVKALFNKDDKADQEKIMEEIRKLEKHFSLYIDGDKRVVKMRDKAFWEL